MTSLEFTGRIPFEDVLVHATVLDIEGRRMSKSLGTGVDPLELIRDYGSDATRFSLLYQCASDQDIRFGEERTEMARNFCNKIWNASRFVLMNLGEDFEPVENAPVIVRETGSPAERWILSRYAATLAIVNETMARYEMAEAARAAYSFFWSEFCDWFVEMCKPALRSGGGEGERAKQTLFFVLEGTLRALHPFMPFITEEIWQELPWTGDSLLVARWPATEAGWRDGAAEREMAALMAVVVAARKLRAGQQVPASQRVHIRVAAGSKAARDVLAANHESVLLLARASELSILDDTEERPAMAELVHCLGAPTAVWIERKVSRREREEQQARLEKELGRLREEEARLAEKLANQQFMSKAPEQIKERIEKRYGEARARAEALGEQLAELLSSLDDTTT